MMKLGFIVMVLVMRFTLQTNIKILDTPDGEKHPEPCALICSGISRHDDNGWYYMTNDKVYKEVDMSGCNFVSQPVVTVTTRDVYDTNDYVCPAFITEDQSKGSFYVLSVQEISTKEVVIRRCDMHWIATGFNC